MKQNSALITSILALITPLPANVFRYKLAANVPDKIFINKPDSSRHLAIFMISFISLFEIVIAVIPDP